MWLVWTVPYFVIASGHEPTSYAEVMNKVNGSMDDNGDRPGYTNVSFSTTRLEEQVCYSLQSLSRKSYLFIFKRPEDGGGFEVS